MIQIIQPKIGKKDIQKTFLFPTRSRQQNVSLSCPKNKSATEWSPSDEIHRNIFEHSFFWWC